MKKLMTIIGAAALLVFAGSAPGEVVIKQTPLQWEDIAYLDGGAAYDNLCASCHGFSGRGDGPAVNAMNRYVPDLTGLSARNGGAFSHYQVKTVIYGESRTGAHDTVNMPAWGQQFMYLRPGLSAFQREAYTRNRIHALTLHVESLQAHN